MLKNLLLLSIIFCLYNADAQIFPALGDQRTGISALTFLKMDVSPRSAALGGANICLGGDGFSAFTNPASLSEMESFFVGASNTFWVSDVNFSALSFGKPMKFGHIALSTTALSSGAMKVRTEWQPDGTGELFYAGYFTAGLTYSKKLTDWFSYGVNLKYVREQLRDFTAQTGMMDLGFLYRTDFKNLRFSVLIQHFGLNSKLNGNFPAADNLGTGRLRRTEDYPAPTVFKLGVSLRAWENADKNQNIDVMLQLNHPNDNAESIRFGFEYAYHELLFIRAGYKLNVADQNLPTAGIGLRMRMGRHPLILDYSAEPIDFLGMVHRVGLTFKVNKETR